MYECDECSGDHYISLTHTNRWQLDSCWDAPVAPSKKYLTGRVARYSFTHNQLSLQFYVKKYFLYA